MSTPTSRRGFLGAAALLGLTGPAGAARNKAPAPPAPYPLLKSEAFSLTFRDRALQIGIAHPFEPDPEVGLMLQGLKPVPVYVTDGSLNLPTVASLVRQMQWGGEAPPCLVIGIDYLDYDASYKGDWRLRELTPTEKPKGFDGVTRGECGGAGQFRDFLVNTLRPMIEKRFDVDSARAVLMGHSLGGMFTLSTMVEQPDAFGNYLAVSPSLWFDENLVLNQFTQKLQAGTVFKSRAAVFAGEQEERISDPQTHMTSNTLELGRLVAQHRSSFPNGALVTVLPGTTHHTIVGTAITRGLRYLLAPDERRSETF